MGERGSRGHHSWYEPGCGVQGDSREPAGFGGAAGREVHRRGFTDEIVAGESVMEYQEFLKGKIDYGIKHGFEPLFMPDFLFDFQQALVDWAVKLGRAGIFADCGMGKTPMQLVWAENIIRKTNKPVLILTPLAVSSQTLDEAEKFGIEAYRADTRLNPTTIQVTNYEKLHYFKPDNYSGIVCDESSILKNFKGTRKADITEFARRIPYRLLCTATAAPNDWIELGTSSEALGYLGYMDMLTRFFTRRQTVAISRGDEWQIKGHAEEPFWRWVASWARAARKPADLGFDNDGFTLPPLEETHTVVKASRPREGMLFDIAAVNFHEEREVTRRTIQERCESVADKVAQHDVSMVWCHLNDESRTLKQIIPNSREISGSDSDEEKEDAARWFCHSKEEKRVLISKPKIFGFGLNFQHCNHMTYFPTHSYEQYYQATRRLWRFGQTSPVTVDLVYTDGGERMMENLSRKSEAADKMFIDLVKYMNQALKVENVYHTKQIGVPQWMK